MTLDLHMKNLTNGQNATVTMVRMKNGWTVMYPSGETFVCPDEHKDGPGFLMFVDLDDKEWKVEVVPS